MVAVAVCVSHRAKEKVASPEYRCLKRAWVFLKPTPVPAGFLFPTLLRIRSSTTPLLLCAPISTQPSSRELAIPCRTAFSTKGCRIICGTSICSISGSIDQSNRNLAPKPQGSPQNRPTVVTSKPANGSGLGLGCFTPTPPEEASLFSCANSVDHI